MPIPRPGSESAKDYIPKCMEAQKNDDKPQDQKLAICYRTYRDAKKSAVVKGTVRLFKSLSGRGIFKAGKPIGTVSTHHDGTKWKKVNEGDWRQMTEEGKETGKTSKIDPEEHFLNKVKRRATTDKGEKRTLFEPTEKQISKWETLGQNQPPIPSDEEFKEKWKKAHHGSDKGWSMGKRDYMLQILRDDPEYKMGIGQGRVDAHTGTDYQKEKLTNKYNLGYHLGFTEYDSNRKGWDDLTQKTFDEKYGPRKDIEHAENKLQSRQYLNVPFSEKDEAKRKGARWDPDKKKWYHDEDHPHPENFEQWKSIESKIRCSLEEIHKAANRLLNG